jgi:hypothetical protein
VSDAWSCLVHLRYADNGKRMYAWIDRSVVCGDCGYTTYGTPCILSRGWGYKNEGIPYIWKEQSAVRLFSTSSGHSIIQLAIVVIFRHTDEEKPLVALVRFVRRQ